MNTKEIGEIRRRIRRDRSNMTAVYGCYVNDKKEIITQFRQITKNKPSFTNDDSLRRMLYLASQRIVRHWHARCQNWDMVLSQLEIMFSDQKAG